MKKLKRRDFLKQAAQSSIALTGSSLWLPFASQMAFAEVGQKKEFDYIVVGSGAGGGPLAVNLAKEGFEVLLIEAGSNKRAFTSEIPAYHALASEDPQISWDFFVRHHDQPEQHSKWNYEKGGVLYPRSSVVGGCTEHNAMICLYPDPSDWDRIFQLTGKQDSLWSSGEMRKLFTDKIENAAYFSDKTPGWHMLEMSPLSLLQKDSQLKKIVLGAAKERYALWDELAKILKTPISSDLLRVNSYLDANRDYHVEGTEFLRMPKSTYKGQRYGVFNYVNETLKNNRQIKGHLTLSPNTLVSEIVFSEASKKATTVDPNDTNKLEAIGVNVLKGAHIYKAHKNSSKATVTETDFYRARNEVILCGGAFNTPQVLMLSGIGPKDQYDGTRAGVKRVEPLKYLDGVGRNLQDRYEVTVVTELEKDLEILKDCEFARSEHDTSDKCLKDWLNQNTRPTSVYSTNGVLTTIKMKSSVCEKDKTDLILFGAPGDFRGYKVGYSEEAIQYKNRFTWAVLKGHSRNRAGRVQLNSDNCLDTPDIHFHYFEGDGGQQDLQAVLEGVQRVRNINDSTFSKYESQLPFQEKPRNHQSVKTYEALDQERYPSKEYQSEEQLKSWIQTEAWGHHASCTCKMGVDPQDGSVINGDFLVHGTTNVRVVDASVFPEIPGLFIVTPIYMISEKASEVIIRQAGQKKKKA